MNADQHKHSNALQDTGEAYAQFRGWTLQCLWCDYSTQGKTKREALTNLQGHYDGLDIGEVELR